MLSYGYKLIRKPHPEKSLKMKDCFILTADLEKAEISPEVCLQLLFNFLKALDTIVTVHILNTEQTCLWRAEVSFSYICGSSREPWRTDVSFLQLLEWWSIKTCPTSRVPPPLSSVIYTADISFISCLTVSLMEVKITPQSYLSILVFILVFLSSKSLFFFPLQTLMLRYESTDPNFFEVFIDNPETNFKLKLSKENESQAVWTCAIRKGHHKIFNKVPLLVNLIICIYMYIYIWQ